jgi:hypothetical protein
VRNARFFAIGWFIGHLAAVIDFLRITGLIGYQPYMDAMIPLSLVSSLIFFSMAIVDQIYTFKLFAHQDALTGLSNRRRLDEVLPQEWNRSLRHKRPLSVLMVDVIFSRRTTTRTGTGPATGVWPMYPGRWTVTQGEPGIWPPGTEARSS